MLVPAFTLIPLAPTATLGLQPAAPAGIQATQSLTVAKTASAFGQEPKGLRVFGRQAGRSRRCADAWPPSGEPRAGRLALNSVPALTC